MTNQILVIATILGALYIGRKQGQPTSGQIVTDGNDAYQKAVFHQDFLNTIVSNTEGNDPRAATVGVFGTAFQVEANNEAEIQSSSLMNYPYDANNPGNELNFEGYGGATEFNYPNIAANSSVPNTGLYRPSFQRENFEILEAFERSSVISTSGTMIYG